MRWIHRRCWDRCGALAAVLGGCTTMGGLGTVGSAVPAQAGADLTDCIVSAAGRAGCATAYAAGARRKRATARARSTRR